MKFYEWEFEDYKKAFFHNLNVMSRTSHGVIDTSASKTKADSMETLDGDRAKMLVNANCIDALKFAFKNRYSVFRKGRDLSKFLIELAEIVNKGIVKKGCMFRSGEDSTKYSYTLIKDIPSEWNSFCSLFNSMISEYSYFISTKIYRPPYIACYAEYAINLIGHFFSDGCCKISLLISTFVCMRFGCACAILNSRDEYYSLPHHNIKMRDIVKSYDFNNFYHWYQKHVDSDYRNFRFIINKSGIDSLTFIMNGCMAGSDSHNFCVIFENHLNDSKILSLTLDCRDLILLDNNFVNKFKAFSKSNKKITIINANRNCEALFVVSGFKNLLKQTTDIEKISTSNLDIIGEGYNGYVYSMNEDSILKHFKKDIPAENIIRESENHKIALYEGNEAPITYGLIYVDDGLGFIADKIKGKPLSEIFLSNNYVDNYNMKKYVDIVKKFHSKISDSIYSDLLDNNELRTLLCKFGVISHLLDSAHLIKLTKILMYFDDDYLLIHGDISPANIIVDNDGRYTLIDLESVSIGPCILDLGNLYRSLLCGKPFVANPEICQEIWDKFIIFYYNDLTDEEKMNKKNLAEIFGHAHSVYYQLKNGDICIEEEINQIHKNIDNFKLD